MILHPGTWSLLIGSALVLLMLLYASGVATQILIGWDYNSSSSVQLTLERKTYLVSSIVHYALFFEVAALLMFIYTVDEMHPFFIGAMCATGVLNANPVGWYVLAVKMMLAFLAAVWLVMNRLDLQSEVYPLTRLKYGALLFMLPFVGLDLYLLIDYFNGLRPEVITSCCGSLFSAGGAGLASEIAAFPPGKMMWIFYCVTLVFGGALLLCRKLQAGATRLTLLVVSILWAVVTMLSIISFISLYIYEIPTHHCPFDMFQNHYNYIGYPVFITMFGAVLYGCLPGLFAGLQRIPSVSGIIFDHEKKWLAKAFFFLVCFMSIVTLQIVSGEFTLEGYF